MAIEEMMERRSNMLLEWTLNGLLTLCFERVLDSWSWSVRFALLWLDSFASFPAVVLTEGLLLLFAR